jgi:RNA polymerase sigma factor (sigma-70 family)
MPVVVAETSLGERVRQGDPGAFEALYQEYGRPIYDFLVRLVRDGAAAEDLVQATFIKAFEHRATLREPAKLRSWLWATAHNQAMNHLARQRRSDPLDEQFDLATLARGPEESAEAKDAAELVWLAAASLEPRQYTVLDLTVRRDLSTQEVAETLGIPVGHAAVLVNRAREALGHAVRYLLVARRREHCPQLAALVPAGVRALTFQPLSGPAARTGAVGAMLYPVICSGASLSQE